MTLLYHDFTAAKRFSQECTLYILTLPLHRNLEVVKSPLTRPQTYCLRCCLFFPTVFVQSVNCPTAIGNRARKKEFSGKWKKLCLFCHIPVCCCFSIFWQIILKALDLKKNIPFFSFNDSETILYFRSWWRCRWMRSAVTVIVPCTLVWRMEGDWKMSSCLQRPGDHLTHSCQLS